MGCLVTGQNQLFSFHTFLGCFKEERSAQYYHLGAGQGISKAKKRTRKLFTLQHSRADSPESIHSPECNLEHAHTDLNTAPFTAVCITQ